MKYKVKKKKALPPPPYMVNGRTLKVAVFELQSMLTVSVAACLCLPDFGILHSGKTHVGSVVTLGWYCSGSLP